MDNQMVLEIRGLCKSFPGVKALDNVGMSVRKGEVHCLVGENGSGKSTLIRSVSGTQPFDAGEIILNGHVYNQLSARQAMDEGVQVIYQDLSLFPHLTVAENIAFNWVVRESKRVVTPKLMAERAIHGLKQLEETLDLDQQVYSLSMAQKQLVAIARAIALEARIIFMDEPTTALSKSEIEALFRVIEGLSGKGISTVFVSHKLDEVFRVSDNITVIRDGRKVGDFVATDLNEESLARHMTGRDILYETYSYLGQRSGQPVLQVRNLTREPHYRNINMEVYPGEIIGITGPLGAGRTEFALSLFGLNKPDSGEVLMDGEPREINTPSQAIEAGIALVPEDRHLEGLFDQKPIGENLVAAVLRKVSPWGIMDKRLVQQESSNWFKRLAVKAGSMEVEVKTLSGGNQQRVVIGKWLATKPKLLILDGPTVGIDVASKSSIHSMVHELARSGMAIIIISDEIMEVYKNSNRIIIMRDGEFVRQADREELTQDEVRDIVEQGVPK